MHFLSSVQLFVSKSNLFSKNSFTKTIRVSKSLGSDQDRRSVCEGYQQRIGNYGNYLNSKCNSEIFGVFTVNIETTKGSFMINYIILGPPKLPKGRLI